jgi:hypothetical protein
MVANKKNPFAYKAKASAKKKATGNAWASQNPKKPITSAIESSNKSMHH